MKIICQIIEQCVIQKARVVESDEKESGRRRILNFGHTMGHGIESALKGRILHGEAVLIGMCAATWLSHFKGSLSKAEFTEILSNLRRIPIETNIQSISFHQIFAFIKKDKKISHENLRFILLDSMNRPSESEAITEKDLADAFAFVKTLF
jgi:3-dehydroquinate synthase